jgi:hypothetical protein
LGEGAGRRKAPALRRLGAGAPKRRARPMRVGGEGEWAPKPPARRVRELGPAGSGRAPGSAPPGRRLPQQPEQA